MASKFFRKLKRKVDSNRAAPSVSAAQKVTRTYELLEQILGHLDPHSLRQARLVNTYWLAIVRNSPVLTPRSTTSNRPRTTTTIPIAAPSVGLTSLVLRFANPDVAAAPFPFPSDPTPASTFHGQLTVDHERWKVDGSVAGHLHEHRHSSLLGHLLAHSDTYILLYAVCSRPSFTALREWLAQMTRPTEPLSLLVATTPAPRRGRRQCIPAAVLATQTDLPAEQWAVSPSEGAALARELECAFVETSAKTGAGVREAFAAACRAHKRARLEALERRRSVGRGGVPAEARERRERWWEWYRAGRGWG